MKPLPELTTYRGTMKLPLAGLLVALGSIVGVGSTGAPWLVGCAFGIGLMACHGGDAPAAAPDPTMLRGLDGADYRPIPEVGEAVTVLIFSSSDCPVANGYAPEIRSLHDDYAARGLRFFVINVEPHTPVAELTAHAHEYGLPRPLLLHREHALAGTVGATVTPEAVVLLPGGEVAYRGRIDDRVPELGVRRPVATRRELRDALDALLVGRDVDVPRTAAVGCLIEDWAQ